MQKHIFKIALFVLLAGALTFSSCKKDDNTQEELITKVIVHLTGLTPSTFSKEFEAQDPDGDGVWNTIQSIDIPSSTAFNVKLHVYSNSSEINDEIIAEKDEHLFTYKITGANIFVSGLDTDSNGKPLGINSTWTSVGASTGTAQIKLYHEPTDKTATEPGGSVDFDVTFPVKVE